MMRYPAATRVRICLTIGAFTLLEVLVSVAVFVLLIVMVAHLMNGASIAIANSRKRLDADSEARMIFDRMAADFSGMTQHNDVDWLFISGTGNDSLFFYSEAPGYFSGGGPQSPISQVGYHITDKVDQGDSGKAIPQFERLGRGLAWDNSSSSLGSPVFLSSGSNSLTVPDSDPDFQPIGEQAYRLEIVLVLSDGTFSQIPVTNPFPIASNRLTATRPPIASDGGAGYAVGSRWYDNTNHRGYVCANNTPGAATWSPLGFRDVSAIIVAIAILDSSSQQLVAEKNKMGVGFADPTEADLKFNPPRLMATTWLTALKANSPISQESMPNIAASQVRIYQRTFFLNKR